MPDSPERANVSFSYRINKDGTHNIRINHIGMPHKDDNEMSRCDLCRFLTRKLERLHYDVFKLTLNRGMFEEKLPKKNQSATTEVRPEPTTEQIYE